MMNATTSENHATVQVTTLEPWSFSTAKWAFFWCFSLTFASLVIVSFPQSRSRRTAISAVLVTACGAFQTGEHILPDAVFVDYYLRFIIILSSHITWLVYSGTLERDIRQKRTEQNPWMRGYKTLFNPRGIGQSWEVAHLWPSNQSDPCAKKGVKEAGRIAAKPATQQSKSSAILSHIGHILLNFTVLCIYYEFLSPSSALSPLLHRPSLALSNFLPDYLILSTYHSLFAVFFISLSLDSPSEWPPLFGFLASAYTLRAFWGRFWHRLIYRSFIGHATIILSAVGVKAKGRMGRAASNVLVFVLSGVMHGAVPWMLGTRCAWRAGIEYWTMQPVGFVLEGSVGWCWGQIRKERLGWVRGDVLDVFERVVGYVWVLSWLVWEAPRREGAVLRCYGL